MYCEKPTATDAETALALADEARRAGIKNGVVQDKLWLPGLRKLKYLLDTGFFGTVLSVRGKFGYWVFDGVHQPNQRPSWNYRKEDGGGMMVDMFCHWRYVIDNLFGEIKALSAIGATRIPERIDENGARYTCTADDAAYGTFELNNGVVCHFNSSWATRDRRERRRRAAGLGRPARRGNAETGVESGHRQPDRLFRRLDTDAQPGPDGQRL